MLGRIGDPRAFLEFVVGRVHSGHCQTPAAGRRLEKRPSSMNRLCDVKVLSLQMDLSMVDLLEQCQHLNPLSTILTCCYFDDVLQDGREHHASVGVLMGLEACLA